jgi:threonyl-tRNA synthetase
MIHSAKYGSIERFLGILIEHTGGAFPSWLAPVQAIVLPVSDKFASYANEVFLHLKDWGVRAELHTGSEKLGYKIRQAQMQKVPYMLVVGAREQERQTVSVRLRSGEDLGEMELRNFFERLQKEVC